MPNCSRLLALQKAACGATRRAQSLLDETDRLVAATGFGPDMILDLMLRALEERKRACAALASHAQLHGCTSADCAWPAAECQTCSLTALLLAGE